MRASPVARGMELGRMSEDFGLEIIRMDPGSMRAGLVVGAKRAISVPWPDSLKPVALMPKNPPKETDPLPEADVLMVTWTSGEARTMAQLLSGDNFDSWYEYRCNVEHFVPLVTGGRAPFNDKDQMDARYHHSLGVWTQCQIGSRIKCVLYKSGLHPAYDGPEVPIVDMWKQIIAQVKPKIVITTGTGGGIGADVALGDVIVAKTCRFDWKTPSMKTKSYAQATYYCSPIDAEQAKSLITDAMLAPNARLLPRGGASPVQIFWQDEKSTCVSTDTFAFDETTNHFGLESIGRVCDMGDATLGLAMEQMTQDGSMPTPSPAWVSVRNASDPQISNPGGAEGMKQAKEQAEKIYSEYQCVTTAGSVITSWAIAIATAADSEA